MDVERDGADAVCIIGVEGAGLRNASMLTTVVSVAMVVREVKIAVIAAGGIGDARTFLAALALGVVLLGTAFCAVKECPISNRYKQALWGPTLMIRDGATLFLPPPKLSRG